MPTGLSNSHAKRKTPVFGSSLGGPGRFVSPRPHPRCPLSTTAFECDGSGFETLGLGAQQNAPYLFGPRSDDGEREPVERLTFARLERLEARRIAVIDGDHVSWSRHRETNEVVSARHGGSRWIGDSCRHERKIPPIG